MESWPISFYSSSIAASSSSSVWLSSQDTRADPAAEQGDPPERPQDPRQADRRRGQDAPHLCHVQGAKVRDLFLDGWIHTEDLCALSQIRVRRRRQGQGGSPHAISLQEGPFGARRHEHSAHHRLRWRYGHLNNNLHHDNGAWRSNSHNRRVLWILLSTWHGDIRYKQVKEANFTKPCASPWTDIITKFGKKALQCKSSHNCKNVCPIKAGSFSFLAPGVRTLLQKFLYTCKYKITQLWYFFLYEMMAK